MNYDDAKVHLLQHDLHFMRKDFNTRCQVLWMSIVWSIWLLRNNFIFNEAQFDEEVLWDQMKVKAWLLSNKRKMKHCSLADWTTNLLEYLEI